mmetsp:Transcript_34608/g.81590  ORF Transcript_34608/g.81590 Transcript_34608/m.81590 type:complete len:396 (+) Transcript_34608:143-1330(+)
MLIGYFLAASEEFFLQDGTVQVEGRRVRRRVFLGSAARLAVPHLRGQEGLQRYRSRGNVTGKLCISGHPVLLQHRGGPALAGPVVRARGGDGRFRVRGPIPGQDANGQPARHIQAVHDPERSHLGSRRYVALDGGHAAVEGQHFRAVDRRGQSPRLHLRSHHARRGLADQHFTEPEAQGGVVLPAHCRIRGGPVQWSRGPQVRESEGDGRLPRWWTGDSHGGDHRGRSSFHFRSEYDVFPADISAFHHQAPARHPGLQRDSGTGHYCPHRQANCVHCVVLCSVVWCTSTSIAFLTRRPFVSLRWKLPRFLRYVRFVPPARHELPAHAVHRPEKFVVWMPQHVPGLREIQYQCGNQGAPINCWCVSNFGYAPQADPNWKPDVGGGLFEAVCPRVLP